MPNTINKPGRYTLEAGRSVCFLGIPLFTLHRSSTNPGPYGAGLCSLDPCGADAFAHNVVDLLNLQDDSPDRVREDYMKK